MAALLAAAPPALHPALNAMPELPARLAALFAEGRDQWPTLAVAPSRLMAFVARTLNGDDIGEPTPDSLADAIDGLRAADLYLACACAGGDATALATFDRVYMREVDIALAKMRVGPPRSHDIKQLVRQRLFVGAANGQDGKIADYAGRGDLRCGHVDLRDLVRAEAPRQGAQSLFVVVGYGLERGPGVICKECGRGEREEERES